MITSRLHPAREGGITGRNERPIGRGPDDPPVGGTHRVGSRPRSECLRLGIRHDQLLPPSLPTDSLLMRSTSGGRNPAAMVRRLLRRLLLLWYRLGTRSGGSVSLRETLPIEASGEASQQAIPDMTSKPNMPPATRTALAATRSPWQGVVAWVLLDWAGSDFSTL